MAAPIDFYYDFSSPYGYMASTQIEGLAHELGRDINWHPILLGPMFKATGAAPIASIPLKSKYAIHDFKRSAKLHGIAYQQPAEFPIATVAAARASLYVRHQSMALAAKFSKKIYAAYFADGLDIRQPEVISQIATSVGIDANQLAQAIQEQSIKDELKQEIATAMDNGVFGSPFIIIDGEPFWGFDRFEHIRLWAQQA